MVARFFKRWTSNCVSWSIVICWGQPKRATKMKTKALDTASCDLKERECPRPTGVSAIAGKRQATA